MKSPPPSLPEENFLINCIHSTKTQYVKLGPEYYVLCLVTTSRKLLNCGCIKLQEYKISGANIGQSAWLLVRCAPICSTFLGCKARELIGISFLVPPSVNNEFRHQFVESWATVHTPWGGENVCRHVVVLVSHTWSVFHAWATYRAITSHNSAVLHLDGTISRCTDHLLQGCRCVASKNTVIDVRSVAAKFFECFATFHSMNSAVCR